MILPVLLDLPGRDEAREAAQRELSKRAYRAAEPPWYMRLLRWFVRQLGDALDRASGSVPGGGWGLVAIALLLAGLVALVLVRLRPTMRRGAVPELFEVGGELTAAQHRARAEQAAAQGRFDEAVRERLRAVVRGLEERGVLDARPGRTADEVAGAAGAAVPQLAGALRAGARLFDDVWYGGRPARQEDYNALVALDEQVGAARLVMA